MFNFIPMASKKPGTKPGTTPATTPIAIQGRAWMRLASGRRLDLINPSPDAWSHDDLATRLSRVYRWGGESSWPRPLSVVQHSLTVLEIVNRWTAERLTPGQARRELLHDAEEAFLGFDCVSPLKRALGAPFQAVTARLMAAVGMRYTLSSWTNAERAIHKLADLVAAATEASHVVGWTAAEIRDVLCLDIDPLDTDPLVSLYGGEPWEPWAADVAAERFLEAMKRHGACTDTGKQNQEGGAA
jgi:5'-deoxynucleotidase YfbR-like HD superfamily hydrolase